MNIDLDAIQARADATTEGPWEVKECAPCTGRGRLDVSIWAHDGNVSIADWCDDDEFTRTDAEFMANARTDVPALLALVREQAAKLERVEGQLADWASMKPFPDVEDSQRWYSLGKRHAADSIRAALTATEAK